MTINDWMKNPDLLYKLNEVPVRLAALMLGRSENAVRLLLSKGELKKQKGKDRRVTIRVQDIRSFMESTL